MAHTIDTLEDIDITLEDDKSEVAVNQSTTISDSVVADNALNMLEAEHLAAIEKNPFSIMFIKNPSEAVQLKAVKLNYHCLHLIKNPSKAVRWAAGYW